MKPSSTFKQAVFFQALFMLGCSHFAFAGRGEYFSRGAINQEVRAIPVRVEGQMSCAASREIAEENTTANCELKIHDAKTGKDYRISGNHRITEDAMTLYQTGSRNVAVVGHFVDTETLSVQKIEKN
jgi:hypothetical protein